LGGGQASQYRDDRAAFDRAARAHTRQHALGDAPLSPLPAAKRLALESLRPHTAANTPAPAPSPGKATPDSAPVPVPVPVPVPLAEAVETAAVSVLPGPAPGGRTLKLARRAPAPL
jgi:hypothetical protein